MSESPRLRAGDNDREGAASDLREHFAAGRLNEDELSDRLSTVYSATTLAELERVRADLPDPRPLPVAAGPSELARRRIYQDVGAVVILDFACVAVWLATGAHGQFWPVWVILASALRLARDAWRLLGPGAGPASSDRRDRARRRRRRRLG